METMQDLFVDEIKDLYSAENQILKALPKIIKAVQSPQVQQALSEHLRVTEGHVRRLEQIASQMGKRPSGKKCIGMEGLIEEGKEALKEGKDPDVLDAALIGAAQKVEHYEIAGYGTARAHAMQLGEQQAVTLLEQTLEEEKEADQKLTELAEAFVNQRAAQDDDEEMEDGRDGQQMMRQTTSRRM